MMRLMHSPIRGSTSSHPGLPLLPPLKGDIVTMDGKSKSDTQNRKQPLRTLEAIQPDAAGIDLGSREHWVAGPPREDGTPNVERFDTTTPGLYRLADWLKE